MPHTKSIRRFTKPRTGIQGPVGRYLIQISESYVNVNVNANVTGTPDQTPRSQYENDVKRHVNGFSNDIKSTPSSQRISKPLSAHLLTIKRKRNCGTAMRLVNLEFKSMDRPEEEANKVHVAPMTTTLTFSDYLCKWCLSYVGQRRQFCSADCAAQFKLCQKRRDQRQDLNISVDYYGNVKLSIQGLPISSTDELSATKPFPGSNGLIGRRGRRRKRCRNCAKLLSDDTEDEFCDDRCETMETERSKKEFVNIFQQKEVAERRRIRKWLTDAQDQYTKQEGDGDLLEGFDVTSGPAALNPLPIIRTPFLTIPETPKPTLSYQSQQTKRITGSYTSRSGGPSHSFRSSHHLIAEKFHLRKDEAITGGHVKLNPTPLRRGPARQEKQSMESDKRQLMVDLKWIPKFFG